MLKVTRHARRFACAAMLTMFVSGNALANFTCHGVVNSLGLTAHGNVNVGVHTYGIWALCNLHSTFTGNGGQVTAPETCRAWYAALLAAKKSETSIILYFESSASTSNGPECTALGSWVVPNPSPYYMDIR